MPDKMTHNRVLNINDIVILAKSAGQEIMSRRGKVIASYKDDDSPVTEADYAAHNVINAGLKTLTPHIPIISEEDTSTHKKIVNEHTTFWVIDPLDGTKSFINGHDGFGVHIALIQNGEAHLGVIHFPALNVTYLTGNDGKAYKIDHDTQQTKQIFVNKSISTPKLKASTSWRAEDQPAHINNIAYDKITGVGGQRICQTAEGLSDIAWIDKPFSWWDVAASHAVLKAAGGDLFELHTQKPVTYNDKRLHILPAIAGNKNIITSLYSPRRQRINKPKI